MNEYKSPLVSCTICRKVISAKGIHQHHRISHTEEGAEHHKRSSKNGRDMRNKNRKKLKEERKTIENNEYDLNPKICKQCGLIELFFSRPENSTQ